MYIIYNKDGSIRETQLNDYINQNSDGVNYIDVAFDGKTYEEYTASVIYTFSNGDTATDSGTTNNAIVTSSGTYKGWRFTLHSAYTQYYGDLKASIVATNKDGTQLFAYNASLTINQTATPTTELTWEEYKSLQARFADYQIAFSDTNVRGYETEADLMEDINELDVMQYAMTSNGIYQVTGTYDEGKVTNKGIELVLGVSTLKNDFVYKGDMDNGATQEVHSGFVSYYTATDGSKVNYGTNPSEFFVSVLDKNSDYDGKIVLGAKEYHFNGAQQVEWLSMDDNSTSVKAPNGTTSIDLGTGIIQLKGNQILLGNYFQIYNGESKAAYLGNIFRVANEFRTYGKTTFYGDTDLEVDPTSDSNLTHKKYVDDSVKTAVDNEASARQTAIDSAIATEVESRSSKDTDLQAQIDAIKESQNFVATYATYADMTSASTSDLDDKDCVLILKDETHDDQAYVYRWNGSKFTEVGELGDYYTKAQIDKMHDNYYTKSETDAKLGGYLKQVIFRQW